MTREEFLQFLTAIYIAFPSLRAWITKNSPDPKATHNVWYKTLAKYTLAECHRVLDSWIDGTRKPFAGYELDQIALLIKAGIEYDRDKMRRHKSELDIVNERMNEARETNAKRAAYQRMPMVGEIYNKIMPHSDAYRNGKITLGEWEVERDKILKEYQIDNS